MNKFWILGVTSALLLGAGCGTDDDGTDEPIQTNQQAVDDPILVPEDVIKDGWVGNDELPVGVKADQTFPPSYVENVQLQSSVKSQGGRGVCSIFSTVAYMEHLYISEGTITDPDFSEQYLQWGAKFLDGSFPNTSGSNGASNLRTIAEHGIPAEEAWAYESAQWGTSDDPECEGDSRPPKCYTNGSPPESATEAEKFFLPDGKWHSTRERSLKGTMYNKKQGVVVGLTFFYQSWNHRRSQLPVNSDYWAKGYVLSPNSEDRRISLEKRAGHSILLVGWDDNLEVAKVDENGNEIKDSQGNPVVEKGFFLFKNSWGTGSFGKSNPNGDGYGWISYDYVEEFGSGRVSDLPELDRDPEICGDGIDNDRNFQTDCDDEACADQAICQSSSELIEVDLTETQIPDNDADGLTLGFTIEGDGQIEAMNISVDITHTFPADLTLTVVHPNGEESILRDADFGNDEENIVETYVVESFVGLDAAGDYTIKIADNAALDDGVVNGIQIEIVK